MDAAFKSKRLYPGYTDAELKAAVARATDPTIKAKMEKEIAARAAGTSKPFTTPQIMGGGTPQFKLGRM